MNPLRFTPMTHPAAASRRRKSASRFRPGCEGLEDRTVPSTVGPEQVSFFHAAAAVVHHHAASHAKPHHVVPKGTAKGTGHIIAGKAHAHPQVHGKHLKLVLNTPTVQSSTSPPPASVPTPTATPAASPTQATASTNTSTTAAPPVAAAPAVTPPTTTTTTTTAATTTTSASTATADPTLVTLNLPPIDLNLLGLEVKTSQITVTVSAQPGNGNLLGNLLTDVANLLNLQGVNNALNNVLGNVITLLNSTSLSINGVNTTTGPLSSAPPSSATTTPVLNLHVAPVHLNLLGAVVDTSPIDLTITAHSGQGLVLGNVVTDLANLFNPPLPNKLDLNYINGQLTTLLNQLNAQLPGIGGTTTTTPTTTAGSQNVLALTVPPIDVNLLGLILQTSQIQVNVNAQSGSGDLLGNVLTDVLNTLNATPQTLSTLNSNLNALLSKVIGVLNASSLVLPSSALSSLSPVIQSLALPNLVNPSGTASAPILNLNIASTDGTTPPVDVNLLGLIVTTSNIQAELLAQTGNGQILGNLLYNVANLLNPGGSINLLTILDELGI